MAASCSHTSRQHQAEGTGLSRDYGLDTDQLLAKQWAQVCLLTESLGFRLLVSRKEKRYERAESSSPSSSSLSVRLLAVSLKWSSS